jgi:hypothetical protein
MWVIFIIAIVVFILYRFISDREKMLNNVQENGGLQEKYKVLLTYFLSDPDAKITIITRDNIVISWKGAYSSAQFSIMQNFGTININWASNNSVAGVVKEKWEFSENIDQHAMAKKIIQDIEFKMNHGIDWAGAHDKINSLVNNYTDTSIEEPFNEDIYLEKNNIESENKLIIPGVGIDGIRINQTTSKEIEIKYGKNYDLVNHNNYSFEMYYSEIGLSCYYKQNDPIKMIFMIKLREEFGAYTEHGIGLDSDVTVAFISVLYGQKSSFSTSDNVDYAYLDYGGIKFYVDKIDAYSRPDEEIIIKSIGIA